MLVSGRVTFPLSFLEGGINGGIPGNSQEAQARDNLLLDISCPFFAADPNPKVWQELVILLFEFPFG